MSSHHKSARDATVLNNQHVSYNNKNLSFILHQTNTGYHGDLDMPSSIQAGPPPKKNYLQKFEISFLNINRDHYMYSS